MTGAHLDVNHMQDISGCSPYLFLSLVLLTWNLIFTLVGVTWEEGELVLLYSLSLVIFFVLSGGISCLNHYSLCCQKPKYHCCCKLGETLTRDMLFISMGTLYLAGDNLPILICDVQPKMDAKNCRIRSSAIEGASLILHALLYLIGQNSTANQTFQVTGSGRIRKAYQSILQLVSTTLFVDQTFSTVVRFVANTDDSESTKQNNSCDYKANATVTMTHNGEVAWFLASLSAIVVVIAMWLIIKNLKDYCSCCFKKLKSEKGYCCSHLLENIFIIVFYVLAIAFMVLYTLGDNDWLWECVLIHNPTQGRETMLSVTLVISLFWVAMYITVIWLPGFGIELERNKFFRNYAYVVIKGEMDKSEWVQKVLTQPAASGQGYTDRTVSSGNIEHDESYTSPGITLTFGEDITLRRGLANTVNYFCCCCYTRQGYTETGQNLTQTSGNREQEVGCTSFTLPIGEDITSRKGLCYSSNNLLGCYNCCDGSTWSINESKNDDSTCWECLVKCKHSQHEESTPPHRPPSSNESDRDTTCWQKVKNKCTVTWSTAAGEIEHDTVLLAYIGKRENLSSEAISKEQTLKLNIGEDRTYPVGTQVWFIIPTVHPSQELIASSSTVPSKLHHKGGEQIETEEQPGAHSVSVDTLHDMSTAVESTMQEVQVEVHDTKSRSSGTSVRCSEDITTAKSLVPQDDRPTLAAAGSPETSPTSTEADAMDSEQNGTDDTIAAGSRSSITS